MSLDLPTPEQPLSPELLKLAAALLDLASERFSGHSCNDYRVPNLVHADREVLCELMNSNSMDDPEDQDKPEGMKGILTDWCLMNALAEGLRRMAGDKPSRARKS